MANAHPQAKDEDYIGHDTSDRQAISTLGTTRRPSVYDVVAGRVGPNGFFSGIQQHSSSVYPSGPEEHLLRRTAIPSEFLHEAVAHVEQEQASCRRGKLPGSDTLKAAHQYMSDFYDAMGSDKAKISSRSLDETALIAVGILLEEAVREILGEDGDMVFVEPEGQENGLEESRTTRYQIKGRVKPMAMPQVESDSEDSLGEEASPAKRRRYRAD